MPLAFIKNEKQQTYTAFDGDYRLECYKDVEVWHYEVWFKGKKVDDDTSGRWWFLDAKTQAENAMSFHKSMLVEKSKPIPTRSNGETL